MSTTIPRVQKALRRLAADAASKSISRLVMWHLSRGLDWETLAQISQGWANRYELTLARDFVEHLDTLAGGETGRVLFEVDGTDAASEALAAELRTALRHKIVLGLLAELGIPRATRRSGGRLPGADVAERGPGAGRPAAMRPAQNWVPFGKFSVAGGAGQGKARRRPICR